MQVGAVGKGFKSCPQCYLCTGIVAFLNGYGCNQLIYPYGRLNIERLNQTVIGFVKEEERIVVFSLISEKLRIFRIEFYRFIVPLLRFFAGIVVGKRIR